MSMQGSPADAGSRGAAARAAHERGQLQAEISNAIVRLHKEFFGKGPTRARSHLARGWLMVVLEDGYTRGERTLIECGHAAQVAQTRLAMRDAVEREYRAVIESILRRRVRSFMSANDPQHDLQAEIFIFSSEDAGDGPEPDFAEIYERARRVRERHAELIDEQRALRAEQQQARLVRHERGEQ